MNIKSKTREAFVRYVPVTAARAAAWGGRGDFDPVGICWGEQIIKRGSKLDGELRFGVDLRKGEDECVVLELQHGSLLPVAVPYFAHESEHRVVGHVR